MFAMLVMFRSGWPGPAKELISSTCFEVIGIVFIWKECVS